MIVGRAQILMKGGLISSGCHEKASENHETSALILGKLSCSLIVIRKVYLGLGFWKKLLL